MAAGISMKTQSDTDIIIAGEKIYDTYVEQHTSTDL